MASKLLRAVLCTVAAHESLVGATTLNLNASQYLNGTDLPFNPRPAPSYMVDNQHNYYHTAPDKGKSNGPVWAYSGSLANYMSNLRDGNVIRGGYAGSNGTRRTAFQAPANEAKRQSSHDYWLHHLAPLGAQPLAGGDDYQFFRNVLDFGADNTGDTDTSEALNAAVSSWSTATAGDSGAPTRCGEECGNTFTQGAVIYFPGGTYKICSPVIQYYYTQFVGDPYDPPTIYGCDKFQGIALFDIQDVGPFVTSSKRGIMSMN